MLVVLAHNCCAKTGDPCAENKINHVVLEGVAHLMHDAPQFVLEIKSEQGVVCLTVITAVNEMVRWVSERTVSM